MATAEARQAAEGIKVDVVLRRYDLESLGTYGGPLEIEIINLDGSESEVVRVSVTVAPD